MDKKEIIKHLEEMAVLLELSGSNPFKVRAFANAGRLIQASSQGIEDWIAAGEVKGIKGVGKGISDLMMELLNTGKSVELEALRKKIPPDLIGMLKIPGMGPKKIKKVWEDLGIVSVGELEYACKENRLVDLEGFGSKTQQKILQGIELVRKFAARHLISKARIEAEQVLGAVANFSGIIRCELAGSIRRWKETIKDIDILVSADEDNRENIMNSFVTLPEVENIVGKGETKSAVVLKNGVSVELRIVADAQFPYALHHLTGSKEHNVAMRQHAKTLNLKMNEYGLFNESEENIFCRDETELFQALRMNFIQPEMRENQGEIEAAIAGELPDLITPGDIKGVVHCHTTWSDGANSIAEMANACRQAGYEYFVVSDHSRSAMYANGLTVERIKAQHEEIDEINHKNPDFRIFKSIECDILPDGQLDYEDSVLETFDLVIASIHSRFKMTEEEGTSRIIRAMENPHVSILGHPTGRLLLAREGYPVDMERVLEAAADLKVAIELNANPHRLDIDWRLLPLAKKKGVRISIDPDAHRIDGLNDIRFGVGIARKGGLSRSDVINTFPAEKFLELVNRK